MHSNIVHKVDKIPKKKVKGDSLITNKKGIALGILTADCAPVFIYDPVNNLISAIHVGWKGAYKKIISITLKKLRSSGSNFNDLIAIIGPCIDKRSYEVRKDFFNKFIKQNKSNKKFFNIKNNKLYFNLNNYIADKILKFVVKKIEIIKKDTYI